MKSIQHFLLICCLLFPGMLIAQDQETRKKKAKDAPEITFEKTIYDYGKIPYQSDGICEFVFKNTGKSPLVINQVKSSCGCTVPLFPKEPIEKNKKGRIEVKYDTKRQGQFMKSITVLTNDPNGPIKLTIKGEVERPSEEELKQMNFERKKQAHDRKKEMEQKRVESSGIKLEKEKSLLEKNN